LMNVHLIDGTYELFRYFFAVPSAKDANGQEIGAVRGVLGSVLSMLEAGATHLGVATDHVVESFRNELYFGYKTSEGVEPELLSQFPILEEALQAMGVLVWPMIEFEADDALASAASKAAADERVAQVIICTPDKDLGQCVVGTRVLQLDRRRETLRDEAGVLAKFGVNPQSIPDYLAVVGDSADGFPGISGWGPKAAALVFSKYPHLEEVPRDCASGMCPFAVRIASPTHCLEPGTKPCSSVSSLLCGSMCPYSIPWMIFCGKVLVRNSSACVSA
jgi:5'-3' exonuclease